MIGKPFGYLKPSTLKEAFDAYQELLIQGKQPLYYAGGSEVITMARAGSRCPDGVIDLKGIPELHVHDIRAGKLMLGACLTLTEIAERNLFPFLSQTVRRIADHTNQCRITLGGNLCGSIIYREAALPLLLADAQVRIYGREGMRASTLQDAFNGRMKLGTGEIVCQVLVDEELLQKPYVHAKKMKSEKIGYPLITLCAMNAGGKMRIGYSGLCQVPFRAPDDDPMKLPMEPLSNLDGTGAYRMFLLPQMVKQAKARLEAGL